MPPPSSSQRAQKEGPGPKIVRETRTFLHRGLVQLKSRTSRDQCLLQETSGYNHQGCLRQFRWMLWSQEMTSLGYDTSLEAMETWTIHSLLFLPFFHSEIYQCLNFSCKRIQVEMFSGDNTAQHENWVFFSSSVYISNIVWITLFLFIIWECWPLWFEFPCLNCALKILSWCL